MSAIEHNSVLALPKLAENVAGHRHKSYIQEVSEKSASVTPLRPKRPLVVDLDGTLVRSDLLIEAAFSELGRRPHSIFGMFAALREGKAALKHRLCEPHDFDPALLPYDETVLRCVQDARAEGRPVYLASASHKRLVGAVVEHLDLFDGYFATDEATNCAGKVKAQMLVDAFGDKNFDYIGNDKADLDVWPHAAKALAIRTSGRVGKSLSSRCDDVEHLEHEPAGWRDWLQLMRVHQYAKNTLVFVPLLTAQMLELNALVTVFLAAVAFSLCASSVYILNDLIDLKDDRAHRSKRFRPLASGAIPLFQAILLAPVLFTIALAIAATISLPFLGVLLGYYALTTAYSFFLKRQLIADVLALAGLYTVRVIGGAVALGVFMSPWFLSFLGAWFLALALIKRYVELQARQQAKLADSSSRDYRNDDMVIVAALAAATGFQSITLFLIYGTSTSAAAAFSRPDLLWFVAPVLTFWLGRALMLAWRGQMHDDPVVFALKDRLSLVTLAAAGGLVLCAM